MPSASNTVTIRRTPAEVFAFIADGTNAPRWRSGVLDVALESGGGLGAHTALEGSGQLYSHPGLAPGVSHPRLLAIHERLRDDNGDDD